MTDYRNIGLFLRHYRELAGLSLAEVSGLVEVNQEELARHEAGEASVPLDLIFALSNVLNIPPDEVVRAFFEAGLKDATSKFDELRKA